MSSSRGYGSPRAEVAADEWLGGAQVALLPSPRVLCHTAALLVPLLPS